MLSLESRLSSTLFLIPFWKSLSKYVIIIKNIRIGGFDEKINFMVIMYCCVLTNNGV